MPRHDVTGSTRLSGRDSRKRRWGLLRAAICCALTSAVAVPLVGTGVAQAAADPQGTVYVADYGANAIDVFAPGSSGNVAPERVITGSSTGISGPGDVKVDSSGDVYVADFSSASVTEYAPQASGNATPICTISGSNTGLLDDDDMSLEPDGTLVIANLADAANDGGSVEVFAPGACGNVAPVESIQGTNTGFNEPDGVGTDAAGTIYADGTLSSSIKEFPPGTNGNATPASTISGSNTGLGSPDDIVVGFSGRLFVTNGFGGSVNSIEVFAPGASGNVAPVQDITGSNTDFGNPDDLAVDTTGKIFVTDSTSQLGAAVLEFASGATGNVAPVATLVGNNTTFNTPEGVAVAGPPVKSSATVTTTASPASISLNASAHDTATVAGGTSPTGSIVFKLFGPNDSTCSATPAYTSPAQNVTGDGAYQSPSFAPTSIGTYHWQALYSGDNQNAPVTTACSDPAETLTVSAATTAQPTTTTTSLSGGGQSGAQISVPAGTSVTDAATLTGTNAATAGGSVTYTVYSDSTCTTAVGSPSTVTVTSGSVPTSSPVTLSTPGTYYWVASYSGDTNNQKSASTCGAETATVTATNSGCRMSGGGYFGPNSADSLSASLSSNLAKPQSLRFVLNGEPFVLTQLTSAVCLNDQGLNPGPGHMFNTLMGSGAGTYGNVAGFTVRFELGDGGQNAAGNGGGRDRVTVSLYNSHGTLVASVHGSLSSRLLPRGVEPNLVETDGS